MLCDLPKRNSPKFPHPIFLPTRKLGPTIRTPELELTECLDECILEDVLSPWRAPPPPPWAAVPATLEDFFISANSRVGPAFCMPLYEAPHSEHCVVTFQSFCISKTIFKITEFKYMTKFLCIKPKSVEQHELF